MHRCTLPPVKAAVRVAYGSDERGGGKTFWTDGRVPIESMCHE
jgi:hypothetical protein